MSFVEKILYWLILKFGYVVFQYGLPKGVVWGPFTAVEYGELCVVRTGRFVQVLIEEHEFKVAQRNIEMAKYAEHIRHGESVIMFLLDRLNELEPDQYEYDPAVEDAIEYFKSIDETVVRD